MTDTSDALYIDCRRTTRAGPDEEGNGVTRGDENATWATEHLDRLKAGTAELQPVVKTLRLGGIEDWRPGWVRKVWEPAPDLLAADGSMFGGYIAALADQALAFAAMSVLPAQHAFRTIGLSVHFYRRSQAEAITIEARVVAKSRQLIHVEAEFRHADGVVIAKASAQQILIPLP